MRNKYRIISKIGLLLVLLGFNMPIACNQNGFQLAAYADSLSYFNGTSMLSLALYGIFIFSVIGGILLLLLALNVRFSKTWDWLDIIGVFVSTFIAYRQMDGGNILGRNALQIGAYIILAGLILSLITLLMDS